MKNMYAVCLYYSTNLVCNKITCKKIIHVICLYYITNSVYLNNVKYLIQTSMAMSTILHLHRILMISEMLIYTVVFRLKPIIIQVNKISV